MLDLPVRDPGGAVATLTGKQKTVLAVVAFTFAFMIFSIVPWAQVIKGPNADSYSWQLDWYFPELAALFIVMSIVVGLIGGLGEKGLTDTLVRGAGDFVGVGLIIVLARGVTVIMNNSQITDTVLHSMENAVSNTSTAVFGGLMFLINLPLAFLVPSTSGHAALAMPILAPLGDFAHVPRSMVVTAYQSASGVVNLITPTSAVVGRGDGWPGPGQGPLRPVAPVHVAADRRPARDVHGLRGHRLPALTGCVPIRAPGERLRTGLTGGPAVSTPKEDVSRPTQPQAWVSPRSGHPRRGMPRRPGPARIRLVGRPGPPG